MIAADWVKMTTGKNMFVVGDFFTRYTWAFYSKGPANSKKTADFLNSIYKMLGPPEILVTDGSSEFKGEVDRQCEAEGIRHHVSPAWSSWSNGLVEGTNRLLIERLRRSTGIQLRDQWNKHLEGAVSHLNHRVVESHGYRPVELLFGLTPRRADDFLSFTDSIDEMNVGDIDADDADLHMALFESKRWAALGNLMLSQDAIRTKSDTKCGRHNFKVGDLVMAHNTQLETQKGRKLEEKWRGPYRVTSCIGGQDGALSFRIQGIYGDDLPGKFHARRLKHYHLDLDAEASFLQGVKEVVNEIQVEDDEEVYLMGEQGIGNGKVFGKGDEGWVAEGKDWTEFLGLESDTAWW